MPLPQGSSPLKSAVRHCAGGFHDSGADYLHQRVPDVFEGKAHRHALPQILPFGANAFGIFLLRQSFRQINPEVFEAARMDDAGEWKIMLKVALPMCRSSLIATMMFSVIGIWNSYFWPLVMTNSDKFRPLTLYVEKLKQDAEQGLQWNLIMRVT